MWAAITIIIINAINLGIHMAKNGEYEKVKYNFPKTLFSTIIAFVLYYFAGTFDSLIK